MIRADYLHFLGDSKGLEKALQSAAEASTDAVAEVATKYLDVGRARFVHLDPLPESEKKPAGATGLAGARLTVEATPVVAATIGQPFWATAPAELKQVRQGRLPNGLTYLVLRRPGQEVVTAALAFRGGEASATPRGVVQMVRYVDDLRDLSLPLNAVRTTAFDHPDFTADVTRVGTGNLSNALFLMALRLVATDGVDWERATERDSSRPVTLALKSSPEIEAHYGLMQALYPDHPYGRPVRDLDRYELRAEHFQQWLPRMRSPRNAILVVTGALDLDEGERLVKAWFGSWKAHELPLPVVPPVPTPAGAPRESTIVTGRRGVNQTELRLACRLPSETDGKTAAANRLLATVVGAHLATRIRHEAGAAYGVNTSVQSLAAGGAHLFVDMAVDDTRLDDVVRSVRGHLQTFAARGFDEGSLSQARWGEAQALNLGYQTSDQVTVEVVSALARGRSLDDIARRGEHLMAVTTADLARAFAVCHRHTVLSLLGDEANIQRSLVAGK